MCAQLTAIGYTFYHWTAERGGYEIDFLIQREGNTLPIEVKAGERTKAKSMEVYQKTFRPEQSTRLSTQKTLVWNMGGNRSPSMSASAFEPTAAPGALELQGPLFTIILGERGYPGAH